MICLKKKVIEQIKIQKSETFKMVKKKYVDDGDGNGYE